MHWNSGFIGPLNVDLADYAAIVASVADATCRPAPLLNISRLPDCNPPSCNAFVTQLGALGESPEHIGR